MPPLLGTFARSILKGDFDVFENANVQNAGRLYLRHCLIARSGGRMVPWKSSRDLPAVQVFPPHWIQFISQYSYDVNLHEKAHHVLCSSCSARWSARFSDFDAKALLGKEFVMWVVKMSAFTNKHMFVGMAALQHKIFHWWSLWDISSVLRFSDPWITAPQENHMEKWLWFSVRMTLKHELLNSGEEYNSLAVPPVIFCSVSLTFSCLRYSKDP